MNQIGQLVVIAGGVAQHDAAHHGEPGTGELVPRKLSPVVTHLGQQVRSFLVRNGDEAFGQVVHLAMGIKHLLVEAAAVGPLGTMRDQYTFGLEV